MRATLSLAAIRDGGRPQGRERERGSNKGTEERYASLLFYIKATPPTHPLTL